MTQVRSWLQGHAFAAYVTAPLLMLTVPPLMFLAARQAAPAWITPPLA